jgi:small conductance mechanosensitive channel
VSSGRSLTIARCDGDDKDKSCELSELLDLFLGTPARIIGILIGAIFLRWILHRFISRVVARAVGLNLKERFPDTRVAKLATSASAALVAERRRQRADTIGSVLRSIASFVVLGMAFAMILGEVGIAIGPLLASAGVAGVALGFGAQSLVRDFLSGIFMILEDQYGVGDLIDTGGAVGTVEEVTLRVTRLRDGSGVVWYVRNGEILRVGNHSQGWSTAVVDISVAYDEDIARVQDLLRTTADELARDDEWSEKILEPAQVAGVESVTGTSVTIRLTVRCAPNEHLGVQRELRARMKAVFDREGITVPLPTSPPATGTTL